MKNYPIGDLEYHEVKVVDADGRTFRGDDGWSFCVPEDSQIMPGAGMVARFYGRGVGCVVRGLFLDGIKVYYRTPDEQKKEDDKWRAEYDAECERRKLDPKNPNPQIEGFEWDNDMAEISGFGSAYEQACRRMVSQGCKWWAEHPNAGPNEDARALEKAMMVGVEDCTGAMHQGALQHILRWHALGSWENYREKSKEIERNRRHDEA